MKQHARRLAQFALALASAPALAHDGHGIAGTHWHASDVFGFLLVGGLAVLAIWWSGRE